MATSPSASEIVTLLMIVLLFPLAMPYAWKVTAPARPWLVWAFLLMAAAAALSVVEHLVGGQLVTDLKNVVYPVASILFATGMAHAVREGRTS